MSRIQSNTPRFSEDQISHATSNPGVRCFPWNPQEPTGSKSNGFMYGILQPQWCFKIYGRCFKKHNWHSEILKNCLRLTVLQSLMGGVFSGGRPRKSWGSQLPRAASFREGNTPTADDTNLQTLRDLDHRCAKTNVTSRSNVDVDSS